MRALVIGGAGFIGSHLVDALIERGFQVTVLDNLDPQVHGHGGRPPEYLNPAAAFVHGDIRQRELLARLVRKVEVIFYEAALIGVDQSIGEIRRYVEVNTLGAATLIEILVNESHKIQKVVVASSAAVYGEGKYRCPEHGIVEGTTRPRAQLVAGQWDPMCPIATCQATLTPLPVEETKPLRPTSIYAITKRDQEEMFLCMARLKGLPVVVLRYFNVYGPRQSESSPYTGVITAFRKRLREGLPPLVYEDGRQTRDFIHVSDVVRANLLAVERDEVNGEVINVGTGQPTAVLELAEMLARVMGIPYTPELTGWYRPGDIRHSIADIRKARDVLGLTGTVPLLEGLRTLCGLGQ